MKAAIVPELPIKTGAGGIIINHKNQVCLVQNKLRGFPKGHNKPNESLIDTAYREVKEETGIKRVELITELGSYTRPSLYQKEIKDITLFLFATLKDFDKIKPYGDPKSKIKDSKIKAVKGVHIDEVTNYLHHEEEKYFFNQYKAYINQQLEELLFTLEDIS